MLQLVSLVPVATQELQRKTLHDIQIETAYTWAARAVAAAKLNRIADAHEYWHEAIEHAALAGVAVLQGIRAEAASLVSIAALE